MAESGTCVVVNVGGKTSRWEVHYEQPGCDRIFTEAFDGLDAESDARELAAYMNAGGQ